RRQCRGGARLRRRAGALAGGPLAPRPFDVSYCFNQKATVSPGGTFMHASLRLLTAAAALACVTGAAQAADSIKVGLLTTLSGPGAALGVDIRDGFQLAVKHAGGTFGDLPAEVIVADDQMSPDAAKQTADRLL